MSIPRKIGAIIAVILFVASSGAALAEADTQDGWFCRFDSPLTINSIPKEPLRLDLTDTGTNEAVKASAQGQGAHFKLNQTETAAFYSLFDRPTYEQCATLIADIRSGKLPLPAQGTQLRPYVPTPAPPTRESQTPQRESNSSNGRSTDGVPAPAGQEPPDLIPVGILTTLGVLVLVALAVKRGRLTR